jgi:hypothetical protein
VLGIETLAGVEAALLVEVAMKGDDFLQTSHVTKAKVLEWVAFCHGWKLQNRPTRLKPICSDSARLSTVSAIG